MFKEIDSDPSNLEVVPLEFTSEIAPTYESTFFELRNFSNYVTDAIVYSPCMMHNGIKWRLKVYPHGNGNARGMFLSVFLEMGSQMVLGSPQRYEYKVEMMNQRNIKSSVIREFSSEFESGECWGYNRFYKIELLKKEGYLLEEEDKVY